MPGAARPRWPLLLPCSSRRVSPLLPNHKSQTIAAEAVAPTTDSCRSDPPGRDSNSKIIVAEADLRSCIATFPPFKLRFLLHLKAQGRLPACPFAAIAAHPWRSSPLPPDFNPTNRESQGFWERPYRLRFPPPCGSGRTDRDSPNHRGEYRRSHRTCSHQRIAAAEHQGGRHFAPHLHDGV